MDNSEITSDKILSILSNRWLTSDDVAYNLEIDQPLDKKYCNLKIKELNRKAEIIPINYDESTYWKSYNSETIEELKISFCLAMLDINPFNAELWYKLGNQYLKKGGYDKDMLDIIDIGIIVRDIFSQSKECYENALQVVDPEFESYLYFDILLSLVLIKILLGEQSEAQVHLDNLLKIAGEFEEEIEGRMYLKLAIVYLYIGDKVQALDYVEYTTHMNLGSYEYNDTIEMIFDRIRSEETQEEEDSTEESLDLEIPKDTANTIHVLQEMLKEMRKLTQSSEKGLVISMKSYIDQSIKPFLDKPSKKMFKRLKEAVTNYKDGFPNDMWESFVQEFHRTLDLYKQLQPSRWQKWGNALLKLIPLIR